jgi:hypothetical protein
MGCFDIFSADSGLHEWSNEIDRFYVNEQNISSNSAVWEYEKRIKITKFSNDYVTLLKSSDHARTEAIREIEAKCKAKNISIKTMHLTFLICESINLRYIELIRWTDVDEWNLPYVLVSLLTETKFDPSDARRSGLFDTRSR